MRGMIGTTMCEGRRGDFGGLDAFRDTGGPAAYVLMHETTEHHLPARHGTRA
jgi:hypothetical protein